MDWISIGSYAICGAIGAVLGVLIGRNQSSRAQGIISTVLIIVLAAIAQETVVPKARAYEIDGELAKLPFCQELRKADPAAYNALRDQLAKAGGSTDRQALTAKVRGQMQAEFTQFLPSASDAALMHFSSATSQMLGELKANPDTCYAFLFPKPGTAPALHTSQRSSDDLMNAMAEVIGSGNARQPIAIDTPAAKEQLQVVLAGIRNKEPDYAAAIAHLTDTQDKAAGCGGTAMLYGDIAQLPEHDGGNLLRYMLAGAK